MKLRRKLVFQVALTSVMSFLPIALPMKVVEVWLKPTRKKRRVYTILKIIEFAASSITPKYPLMNMSMHLEEVSTNLFTTYHRPSLNWSLMLEGLITSLVGRNHVSTISFCIYPANIVRV